MVEKLENLIAKDYEKLYAYTFRMVGNHQDTEDVIQNAFIKAYKGINKFRGDSSLNTWLYRILVNESYRNFEQIKRLPISLITESSNISEIDFFENIDYDEKIDDKLVIDELRERCLFAFLKCVPKKQRVIFLLKTCLNISNDEIAKVMEMTVSNVKVTLYRARLRLQDLFNNRCSLIDPNKPCKCYLWIKYMKDHNRPLPSGYNQYKNDELKKQHFKNMDNLKKIDYLYSVKAELTKEEFLDKLRILQKAI